MTSVCTLLFQITNAALVAPASWIAVALLHGKYIECAMTGTSFYNKHLCGNQSSGVLCEKELHRFPCGTSTSVPPVEQQEVLLQLKAQSQIAGWLLIAFVMLSSLLITCVARCTSPISYLQLKFWRAYVQEESSLIDSKTTEHAKEFAERNLESFFKQTPPKNIITPSKGDWEKISSLYKFSTKDHYYSTLHRCVEDCQETVDGMIRMGSVRANEPVEETPAALDFVDGGRV